jgi:hypothetical protein
VRYIARFVRFWYDFIVGDDWRLAAGTAALLVLVHLAASRWERSWMLLPLGVLLLLAASVRHAARTARRHPSPAR